MMPCNANISSYLSLSSQKYADIAVLVACIYKGRIVHLSYSDVAPLIVIVMFIARSYACVIFNIIT